MADRAMDVYLNDHLAGAMAGSDLAERIREQNEGTPLGEVMQTLAAQIEEDRQALVALMEQMGTTRNPAKQAAGWIAEKASQIKFSGLVSGEPDHGTFMALESLTLGVSGKACLWRALKEVENAYPPLASLDLDRLIDRADRQCRELERERKAAGRQALAS